MRTLLHVMLTFTFPMPDYKKKRACCITRLLLFFFFRSGYNPRYSLRNWIAEKAIKLAEMDDFSGVSFRFSLSRSQNHIYILSINFTECHYFAMEINFKLIWFFRFKVCLRLFRILLSNRYELRRLVLERYTAYSNIATKQILRVVHIPYA